MRRLAWLALLPILLLGCRGDDIAAPEIRRPLEDLPAGATALVLTSDLRNTWERAVGHDLGAVVERLRPLQAALADTNVVRLRAAWRELQAQSGVDLERDVLLNLVGERAGLAYYRGERAGARRGDLLLVGELASVERFEKAIAALRTHLATIGFQAADVTIAGQPALRLRGASGTDLLMLQAGSFLAIATRDSLALQSLAIHAGGPAGSALRDPEFQAALRSLQPHVVTALERTDDATAPWIAQGFTWDPTGMHFEQVRPMPGTATAGPPAARDAILGSLPDGGAIAAYVRPADLAWGSMLGPWGGMLHPAAGDSARGTDERAAGPLSGMFPGGLSNLFAGEGGVVIQGVASTAVAPWPEVGLVLTLRDPAAASTAIRFVDASLGAVRLQGKGYELEDVSYGGRTFRSLVQPISEAVTPSYLLDGDLCFVTSTRRLMQQIIDTRRSGKRSVLTDRSFRGLREFVPPNASAVAYGDPTRLDRALAQVEPLVGRWPGVQRLVEDARSVTPLGAHFPAAAIYALREPDRLVVRGWLQEGS